VNVFHLRQGATLQNVNSQLIRLAPPGANVCIVEAVGDTVDEQLATDVANLLGQARSSKVVEQKVMGYQIGALPDFRNKPYKLYFIG
jgi:hypothetical protein